MKKGLLLIIGLCLVAIVAFVTIFPLAPHRDEPMPLGTISNGISIEEYKVGDKFYKGVIFKPSKVSPALIGARESREIYEINAPKGSEFLWVHIKVVNRRSPSVSDIRLLYNGEEITCEEWPSIGESESLWWTGTYYELGRGFYEEYEYYWAEKKSDITYRGQYQKINRYCGDLDVREHEGWIYFIVPKTFNPGDAIIKIGLKKWKLY